MKASANSIEARNASSSPVRMTPMQADAAGIKLHRGPYYDTYAGTAEALVAAGIVSRDQLPGINPDLARCAVTFYRGEYVRGRQKTPHDEHWLNITRSGRKYTVYVGVGAEETERRHQANSQRAKMEREREEQARNEAFHSSPEQLRETARSLCRVLQTILANHTPGDHERGEAIYFCRFSSRGIEDVLSSLEEVSEWIEEAEIAPVDRTALKIRAAQEDASFQAFLAVQCLGGA